jgi:hypothetical protein
MSETLRVRDAQGRVATMMKILTAAYCSVQMKGEDYYKLRKMEDLTPIDEDEYRRGK